VELEPGRAARSLPNDVAVERQAIAREVQTYKTRLRPLIREANLYHILPRPDDRNGIQYHNPASGNGVAYIFKPASEQNFQRIRLKGLDREATYRLDFEDGSNSPVVLSGGELMGEGFPMSLEGVSVSELVRVNRP
jgi:alpha-galactosidase